jgi:hypothetical protein
MKQNETNKTANQLLHDFDALKPIEPSDDWEQKFFLKLSEANRSKSMHLVSFKTLVVIIVFLLVNGLAVLQSNRSYSPRNTERKQLLQNISEQLLINSTASN